MLYKDPKVMVSLLDGAIDFFTMVAGVLQRDTSAHFLFIIGLRTSIDIMIKNGFTLKKKARN